MRSTGLHEPESDSWAVLIKGYQWEIMVKAARVLANQRDIAETTDWGPFHQLIHKIAQGYNPRIELHATIVIDERETAND